MRLCVCRSLDKEGQWTKFADTPVLEKTAGGTKRGAAEVVPKFEGDVRALKQWRGDLIAKCDEAKAAYQKALGANDAAAMRSAARPLSLRCAAVLLYDRGH